MQTTVTCERLVAAAVERVWTLLVDPHGPSMQPGVVVGESWGVPGTVGSGYEVVGRKGPVRVQITVEVVQAEPPSRIVLVQRAGGRVLASSRYALGLADEGTRVQASTTCPGLLARVGRGSLRRSQERWLDRLAAELEA